ncbi:protein of unknown function [Sterolibacterium denitrificans]|uniref:Uncharacterized protein n=1 Tax=Sterolibacterium denitrificans TaxID=157592 RepID=A0A7Z7MU37_9PROT|nr:hypothetical protein [Sterolibacterium denitrificans]SMB21533.1 protein of unknown function [Sterolibacterium denitrificans]
MAGDLFNGGTIAGRQLVAIDAENLHNLQGRILGNTVQVADRQLDGQARGILRRVA